MLLQDDPLTVSAQRERTEERAENGFVRFKRRFGSFSRAVGVPQGVTEDKVKADCRDGVLEIRVANPETQKPKKIAPPRRGTVGPWPPFPMG